MRIARRTPDVSAPSAPSPARRLMRPRGGDAPAAPAPTPVDHEHIITTAFSDLDDVDTQIAILAGQKARLEATITEHMEEGKLDEVTDGRFIAKREDIKSRGSRTISAKDFFDIVAERGPADEAAAWEAMGVSSTEAAKLLTARELDKNFPMTKGKVTGQRIAIERVEVKLGRKKG